MKRKGRIATRKMGGNFDRDLSRRIDAVRYLLEG